MLAALYERGIFVRYVEIPYRMESVSVCEPPSLDGVMVSSCSVFPDSRIKHYVLRREIGRRFLEGIIYNVHVQNDGNIKAFIYDLAEQINKGLEEVKG